MSYPPQPIYTHAYPLQPMKIKVKLDKRNRFTVPKWMQDAMEITPDMDHLDVEIINGELHITKPKKEGQ